MHVNGDAKEHGADEALYLDPVEHRYFEETNSSNILFYINDKIATPDSKAILPSITKDALLTIANEELNIDSEYRKIDVNELQNCRKLQYAEQLFHWFMFIKLKKLILKMNLIFQLRTPSLLPYITIIMA